ncbi:MAG: hypothetical protein LQ351_005648 [Letrouitia transgressa]|nr:MAG: hypothetical protein LQ351_005648 [Letrouitia transgressa]
MSEEYGLPQYLLTGWNFRSDARRRAEDNHELDDWSVSSLGSSYLKYQLDHHAELIKQQAMANKDLCTQSLAKLAVQKTLNILTSSLNLRADVKRITETVDSEALKLLLKDPRTPYPVLYLLYEESAIRNEIKSNRKIIDIDEIILANELNIRALAQKNDRAYLVRLDDFRVLFGSESTIQSLDINRKAPPKGGFEFYDELRSNAIHVHASDHSFSKSFNRITEGILYGLDWSNVFAAGGMILTALLRDPEEDFAITHEKVEIYLYGLTPMQATAKVEEIYRVWKANLPSSNNESLVQKTPDTIEFIADYIGHGIYIVTKLFQTPLDILLNFDLDALAVGFDGSQVTMLPRCARAIETGYSVFTMDLIRRHHPSNRQPTYGLRISRHADRGFGLRILPSYIKALELPRLESTVLNLSNAGCDKTDLDKFHIALQQRSHNPTACQPNEPGLKSLRRIAHLAKEYVQWNSFGFGGSSECPLGSPEWDKARLLASKTIGGFAGSWTSCPASFSSFESFMRECEAWRLAAINVSLYNNDSGFFVRLRPGSPESCLYDTELATDECNGFLFSKLREIVESRVHGIGSYRGYLTRKIRHTIEGSDLAAVQAKQITLPLVIPSNLQDCVTRQLSSRYPEIESLVRNLLIPIHDSAVYRPLGFPALPSLIDTATENGNLRYWLITNQSMWSGQHYALSEAAELLSILFQWFFLLDENEDLPRDDGEVPGTENAHCIWYVADELRKQLFLPNLQAPASTARRLKIPLNEALLFRSWMAETPETEDANRFWSHRAPMDEASMVDESLFWKPGDEGDWDEEGAPAWT